jgi:hypothetical protein
MFKHMNVIFFIVCIIAGCGMDTQIVKVVEKQNDDTGEQQLDTFVTIDDTSTDHSDTGDSQPALEGVVGYANYKLQQIACPECVGSVQGISLNFSAQFHQPISDTHTEWIPNSGECVQNLPIISPSINPIDVGSQITINGPVHSFVAPKVGSTYQTSAIYETQYDRDSVHAVTSNILSDGFEFSSSRGFDYIEPVSMLYVDISYAYQAPIYRSGTTFYWGPSGSEENFMVIVAVYTNNGTSLIGYTTCVSEDVGVLNIPGTYLSSYPPGSLVAIHLSRQHVELVPAYELGGYVEAHMEWEVIGTGYIQ